MWKVAIIAVLLCGGAGCRCQSDFKESRGDAASPSLASSPDAGLSRWCRTCALRTFLACKRVSGVGTEEEIRKKARAEACTDAGLADAECTQDKIRFEECGIETF